MTDDRNAPTVNTPTVNTPGIDGDQPNRRRGSSVAKVGLSVICALLAGMWIYYFFFAPTKAAYRIDDAAWRQRAETVCAGYEAERLKLVDTDGGYIASPTKEQMIQRADVVDASTDILEAELDELVSVQPSSDRDRELLGKYEGYYRTMLSDRRLYTSQLRSFNLEPYSETLVGGGPVTNSLIDFTTINLIPSCTPPGELGGDI